MLARQANADSQPINVDGKSYTVFCGEPSQDTHWSYAEVVDYLLCEYLTVGQLQTPDIGQLRMLTENQAVRDLDVTGLNLIAAWQMDSASFHLDQKTGRMFEVDGDN